MKKKMINRQIMIILVLIAATLSGCNKTISKEDFIIKEKDLIPESLCVDSRTGIIYVGSTYKRKIIQIIHVGLTVNQNALRMEMLPTFFHKRQMVSGAWLE